MSEIKAGDLVIMVRPRRCGCASTVGAIRKVLSINTDHRSGYCHTCNSKTFPPYTPAAELVEGGYAEISRLIKIDPPATGDTLPKRKQLKVKA